VAGRDDDGDCSGVEQRNDVAMTMLTVQAGTLERLPRSSLYRERLLIPVQFDEAQASLFRYFQTSKCSRDPNQSTRQVKSQQESSFDILVIAPSRIGYVDLGNQSPSLLFSEMGHSERCRQCQRERRPCARWSYYIPCERCYQLNQDCIIGGYQCYGAPCSSW
jgi:hypothetical protein